MAESVFKGSWFMSLYFLGLFVLVSFGLAAFIFPNITFSKSTLLWFSSTIAQAFGALMAIIVALALHRRTTLREILSDYIGKHKLDKEDEILITAQKSIWKSIELPIMTMAWLITLSLFFMMLIDSSLPESELRISYAFWFLFLYSVFAVALLIYRLGKLFEVKKEKKK